jgi:AbiV family abortive infection protein
MSKSIPWSRLEEGISAIFENIQTLIGSADVLYQNKKYMVSASLSIFAFEEINKSELLLDYYKNQKDLPLDKWNELVKGKEAHFNKLLKFLEKETIRVLNFTNEMTNYTEEQLERMTADHYHSVKMNVFYVNWMEKECKWRWFPNEYPQNLQENMAIYFLRTAKRRFNETNRQKQSV